jgi:hypothetical protein
VCTVGDVRLRRRPVDLRNQVIKPLLGGLAAPKRGRKPSTWTPLDRHYEQLRLDIQLVFHDLGIAV